ncbi:hypothetical protein Tco_1112028 [Tanacetum coccineum]|uniref:Uncharacterized protein n=1 Tax=Tanacetum coccineum TaxID=301880 RepID=A0ABQ5IPP2_9ASTR
MKKRLARKKSLMKQLMQKESISKQGRKLAKSEPTDAQDEGRTSSKTLKLSLSGDTMVLEEKESKEKGVSTEDPVSTAQPKVSTDKPKLVLTSQKLAPTRMMKVEFKRISLTGFRSCTSRSRYRSVSKQTTRLEQTATFFNINESSRNEKADRNVLISVRNETNFF